MLCNPKSIANYFIELANANGQSISPMKLQKLVYYAHGWYAGYTGQPLINEAVEAWQYGPVIPSLYHEFKRYGAGSITSKASDFEGLEFREVAPPSDPALRQFLQNVWRTYGQFTGVRLSELTHAADGPWDQTRKKSEGMRGADIPFDLIVEHFKAAVEKTQQRKAQA